VTDTDEPPDPVEGTAVTANTDWSDPGEERTAWHILLAVMLSELLGPTGVEVRSEVEVTRGIPRADLILVRRHGRARTEEQRCLLANGLRDLTARPGSQPAGGSEGVGAGAQGRPKGGRDAARKACEDGASKQARDAPPGRPKLAYYAVNCVRSSAVSRSGSRTRLQLLRPRISNAGANAFSQPKPWTRCSSLKNTGYRWRAEGATNQEKNTARRQCFTGSADGPANTFLRDFQSGYIAALASATQPSNTS